MMTKITENTIEKFAIELLERLGYQYIYAPDIAHDGERPERNSYEEVLLTERLQSAIRRINPNIPLDAQEEALKEIQRINSPELLANNEAFHRMLTEGINVSYQKDLPASAGQAGGTETRGDLVWLIDFETPENNDFIVANQFTVIENGNNKRPDVILFVNGIPLVVLELKNPVDENATIKSAYKQLQTYKATIPSLFTYNGFMVISDGLEAKAGSLSAGLTRFMAWKSADGKEEASNLVSQLETLINGMLNKETLLDLIRHFVVFEKSTCLRANTHRQKKEDSKTGIVSISTVKKLAAYHQYYAVNRAVESALRATGYLAVQTGHALSQRSPTLSQQKAKAKWTQLEALIGSENRVKNIAKDIVYHFEQRQEVFDGKGMIVSMSRRIAADLYDEIIKLKPDWHSDNLDKGVLKVVMTSKSSDGPKIAKHHTTKQQRKILADRMKDTEDELKLVIVRDMWLTGFDVPMLHTLYIDKPMKGHNLMQAIARVNRVYKDKPGGLVVDYLGIASDLKKALSFYSDAGGKGDPTILQEQAVELMLEKLEVVSQMFHKFPYEEYFEADTSKKLSMILSAEEHILGLEDGKKRYINEVTALSKSFAIAIPHEQAMDVKDEIAFFQTVKARLAKFDITGAGRTDEEIETTIRQVIDEALVSEKVIDIFDAAGIKKPDISILSEDFLLELKGMEHKNVALEVLKKLLNDEIKTRSKKNLVKSKSLMEMLENAIKKYHNKILTAAEVMDELIKLSKEIVNMDSEAKALGLTDFEYAFYTAISDNDSAKELMQKDKLRELAVILTERVKANASIDWTIKESVRAKLKVIIKRTLRQYGYPPDMQKLATETVLKQAELIANELTNE